MENQAINESKRKKSKRKGSHPNQYRRKSKTKRNHPNQYGGAVKSTRTVHSLQLLFAVSTVTTIAKDLN